MYTEELISFVSQFPRGITVHHKEDIFDSWFSVREISTDYRYSDVRIYKFSELYDQLKEIKGKAGGSFTLRNTVRGMVMKATE